MQHKIYWGPLKKPIEWSLKTVLAPWAYIASVLYHDTFWYPINAERMMAQRAGERVGPAVPELGRRQAAKADGRGYPDVGEAPAVVVRQGGRAFARRFGVLGTCVREAPEFANKKRKVIVK